MPGEDRDEAMIREAWENTEETALSIGNRFGMTKNVVVGIARRRGWKERAPPRPRSPASPASNHNDPPASPA